MRGMAKLTCWHGGSVYVRPSQVAMVAPQREGTRITLKSDSYAIVSETAEEVDVLLASALSEDAQVSAKVMLSDSLISQIADEVGKVSA